MRDVLREDEVREVLRQDFYEDGGKRGRSRSRRRSAARVKAKPDHYQVICISMYTEDLERLDAKVAELKSKGHRKMNRSALIRFALDQMDASKLPRSY